MANKDALYTARWYAKQILQSTQDERVRTLALEQRDLLTSLIGDTEKVEPTEPERETPEPDEAGMVHLGVIVGHTSSAKGAALHGGGNEYDYHSEIAELVEAKAKANFGNIKVSVIFRDGIGISGAYQKAKALGCDCVVEVHYNAFNKQVQGTETLCSFDQRDKEFAAIMQARLCRVFERQGQSRGVKPISRSARGGSSCHGFPQGANCLTEAFFGDNPLDAAMANTKKHEYAMGLLEATYLWAQKVELIK